MEWAFGDFVLNVSRAELSGPDGPVHLEKYPFELLVLLAGNANRVVTKDEIIEVVWGGRIVSDAAISTAVKQARKAVDDNGADQRVIKTVHGRGFRFVAELRAPRPAEPARPEPVRPEPLAEVPDIAPAGTAKPSIAVLRFQYLGASGPASPLAVAVPAELISSRGRMHWAQVIARGSSFRFEPEDFDAGDVGRRLGARYLISGSLEAVGETLTFTVELIEAAGGSLLWTERFATTLAEVQVARMRIVSAIISALEVELPRFEADAARRLSPNEFDAWSHYHLGLRHMYRYNEADNAIAAQHFDRAITLDPEFARAYAGLSISNWQQAFMQYGERRADPLERALRAAGRALEIDANEPLALYSMGRARWLEGDTDSGVAWMDRALLINPNFAHCHYLRGISLMLSGSLTEATRSSTTALRLSPLDPLSYAMICVNAMSAHGQGRMAEAVRGAEQAVETPGAHFFIVMIAAYMNEIAGNHARAQFHATRAKALRPDASVALFFQAFPFSEQQTKKEIATALGRLGF